MAVLGGNLFIPKENKIFVNWIQIRLASLSRREIILRWLSNWIGGRDPASVEVWTSSVFSFLFFPFLSCYLDRGGWLVGWFVGWVFS